MRTSVALAGVTVAISVALSGQSSPALTRLLEADLARFPAKAGVYVKHLKTGDEAAVRADEPFNSASVIKIPVMVLAYRLAEQGRLSLDERVELRKSDLRSGSGVLRYHDIGLRLTVRDLITQMIITSDNTATDMMIAKVGGVGPVNVWLKENGYAELRLNSTVFEVFRKRYELADAAMKTLTPEDLYALQTGELAFGTSPRPKLEAMQQTLRRPGLDDEWNRRTNEDEAYWLGVITPRGVGRMLEAIERGTIASKESSAEMTRAFRRQQSGARRLPHFINVPVGHKTGDFPPVLANDVGIIYARSGPIVVSFLTNAIREPYAETEDRIGRAAQLIVGYFDGVGR